MHTHPTPRVGGIAVFGAIVIGVIFSSASISGTHTDFVLVSSLLFFVGLAEDLGFKILMSKIHPKILKSISNALWQ